jgi:hypothetical protein
LGPIQQGARSPNLSRRNHGREHRQARFSLPLVG